MKFKDLIKDAKTNGISLEKMLWDNSDDFEEVLCLVAEEHPEEHRRFVRKLHESIYGCHYDKHFAEADVEGIRFTSANGEKRMGAHWSVDQIQDATKGMSFPNKTTTWDKYVAFNSFYADTCGAIEDEAKLLKVAHKFYFADEDAPEGKIWHYMSCLKRED